MIAAAGRPDQPRRQDLARRRRRPRHGQDLRLRRRGAARSTRSRSVHRARTARASSEGDVISIDGSTGAVYLGEVPGRPPPVVAATSRASSTPDGDDADDAGAQPSHRIAGPRRRDGAGSACAPTPTPPRTPRAPAGSAPQGIGLCRTEHMFLGDRPRAGRAADPGRRTTRSGSAALDAAAAAAARGLPRDLRGDGRPAGDDPAARPAAARVPARPHRAVRPGRRRRGDRPTRRRGTTAAARRGAADARAEPDARACAASGSASSSPACSRMQVRAIAEAAAERKQAGGDPRPEIMIPLVGAVQELEAIRDEARAGPRRASRGAGVTLDALIGTMIEVPRAALTAGEIAEAADFFSFGTNDLTQMTLGLLPRRRRGGVLPALPGQGHLRRLAVRVARRRRRRPAGPDRRRGGPGGPARPQARRLRRARRRPRLGALLPGGPARLRVLLAVPSRSPGWRRPGGGAPVVGGGHGQPLTAPPTR